MSGSAKTFPGRLAWAEHQALARRLWAVRAELQAIGAVLEATYGKSDAKPRSLERTLAALDLVRGHCSYALLHEHAAAAARTLGFQALSAENLR
jgi:hypothetical protein